MFNGELPLLVQPIPYALSLMCVPYKDFLSHNWPWVGAFVLHLHISSLLLVNNYIPIFPLVRLFAALIRPTHSSWCLKDMSGMLIAESKLFPCILPNCALRWPLNLVWHEVTLLMSLYIACKPFTCSYMIILYCWVHVILTKECCT